MSVNGLNATMPMPGQMAGLRASQPRPDAAANNAGNVNVPAPQQPAARTADINSVGQGTRTAATYAPQRTAATAPAQAAAPARQAAAPAQTAQQPSSAAQSATAAQRPGVNGRSNVDMVAETANRMNAQNAYGAAVPAAQAMNGMSQTLMDMRG